MMIRENCIWKMFCYSLARQEAETSLEMLIFTRENADSHMNLQRFYRKSKIHIK